MKLIIILLLVLNVSITCLCQSPYATIGGQVSLVPNQPLNSWADNFNSNNSMYHSDIKIPDFTFGPVIGFSMFNNHFYTGFNYIWNGASKRYSKTNIYGETERRKFKLKYNHIEIPFFYFFGESPFGVGATMDVGGHKLVEYREKDSGAGFENKGSQYLKQTQLGTKLGLMFFTRDERATAITAMLYYQTGFFNGELNGYGGYWRIKPNQVGLRMSIGFRLND